MNCQPNGGEVLSARCLQWLDKCHYWCMVCRNFKSMKAKEFFNHLASDHSTTVADYVVSFGDVMTIKTVFQCNLCGQKNLLHNRASIESHARDCHKMNVQEFYERQHATKEVVPSTDDVTKTAPVSSTFGEQCLATAEILNTVFSPDRLGHMADVKDKFLEWANRCMLKCSVCDDFKSRSSIELHNHLRVSHQTPTGSYIDKEGREVTGNLIGIDESVVMTCTLCGTGFLNYLPNVYNHAFNVHNMTVWDYYLQCTAKAKGTQCSLLPPTVVQYLDSQLNTQNPLVPMPAQLNKSYYPLVASQTPKAPAPMMTVPGPVQPLTNANPDVVYATKSQPPPIQQTMTPPATPPPFSDVTNELPDDLAASKPLKKRGWVKGRPRGKKNVNGLSEVKTEMASSANQDLLPGPETSKPLKKRGWVKGRPRGKKKDKKVPLLSNHQEKPNNFKESLSEDSELKVPSGQSPPAAKEQRQSLCASNIDETTTKTDASSDLYSLKLIIHQGQNAKGPLTSDTWDLFCEQLAVSCQEAELRLKREWEKEPGGREKAPTLNVQSFGHSQDHGYILPRDKASQKLIVDLVSKIRVGDVCFSAWPSANDGIEPGTALLWFKVSMDTLKGKRPEQLFSEVARQNSWRMREHVKFHSCEMDKSDPEVFRLMFTAAEDLVHDIVFNKMGMIEMSAETSLTPFIHLFYDDEKLSATLAVND